uniref:receptor protein-tyrosine kinase n=1 Tax=Trichobilharzia regenti TaxID=157069 RepID=A0AA85K057_TRIRE|nr:unnamed protein product [Trichobilharzia regenti]
MLCITFESITYLVWLDINLKTRLLIFLTLLNMSMFTCKNTEFSPEVFTSVKQHSSFSSDLPKYVTSYSDSIKKHRVELIPIKATPEYVILLDTDVTDWNNWTRNTGKYEGWRQQTHPILQRKIYGVCQIAQEHNDNWLYSPSVHITEAKNIIVEVTFTIRECREHPNSEVLRHCQEVLELLLRQDDGLVTNENDANNVQNLYAKLATLSTSNKSQHDLSTEGFLSSWNVSNQNTNNNANDLSSEQVNVYITRFNVQNENIQIAIRDRGSCSTIRRVRIGFIVCPFIRRNFVEYPRTVTGRIMEGLSVDGRCISGAALLNHREVPKLICQTDGLWYYEALVSIDPAGETSINSLTRSDYLNHLDRPCECMPGFGVSNEDRLTDQLCEPCGLYHYKSTFGPFPCQRCPLNSHNPFHTLSGRSTHGLNYLKYGSPVLKYNGSFQHEVDNCVCDAGYYRHPVLDRPDSPCTKIPSAPRNVTVNLSDPARVQLSWNEPIETGGRSNVWYTFNCIELPNQLCSPYLTTVPTVPTLTTSLTLIGLNLGKSIVLSIIATNELSEHLSHMELIQSTTSITIHLPKPINISVGNVHFNEVKHWKDSTRKNSIEKIPQSDYNSLTSGELQTNQQVGGFTVIEYQVYVWISSTVMEFENTYYESKPALTHFLSETSIFLTDLPQPGALGIWVRPRLSTGWGIFKKSVYYYSNMNAEEDGEKRMTTYSPLLMDTASKDLLTTSNHSQTIKLVHTSNRFRILMGILGLGAILLCCLVAILIFLRFCSKQNRFRDRNTQMETVLVPNSLNGVTNENIDKPTERDLQLEAPDSPSVSDHSTPLKSTVCDPLQPPASIREINKEIDPRRIMIKKTIGEGEFGKVCAGDFLALPDSKPQLVAIKMLHPNVNEKTRQDFLTEADTMSQLDHPNIVQLIGLVTQSEPKMIIIEFMENGSLDNFLRCSGGKLATEQLLYMLRDIASGMNYLAHLNFVHRDLAARNILVDKFNTCKVSDFGLTRKVGSDTAEDAYTFTGGKVPIRWTAPEAIMYRKFTISSDIWSFGIVAWELFSLGERPYWNWTNQAVIAMVEKGYRLPAPKACSDDIYQIMTACWDNNPEYRPKFSSICEQINVSIDKYLQTCRKVDYLNINELKTANSSSLTLSWINDDVDDIAYCLLPKSTDNGLLTPSFNNNNSNNSNNNNNNNASQISRNSSYKMYASFSSSNTYFNMNRVNTASEENPLYNNNNNNNNNKRECKNDISMREFKDTISSLRNDTGKCSVNSNNNYGQEKLLYYANNHSTNEHKIEAMNGKYISFSKPKCNVYA